MSSFENARELVPVVRPSLKMEVPLKPLPVPNLEAENSRHSRVFERIQSAAPNYPETIPQRIARMAELLRQGMIDFEFNLRDNSPFQIVTDPMAYQYRQQLAELVQTPRGTSAPQLVKDVTSLIYHDLFMRGHGSSNPPDGLIACAISADQMDLITKSSPEAIEEAFHLAVLSACYKVAKYQSTRPLFQLIEAMTWLTSDLNKSETKNSIDLVKCGAGEMLDAIVSLSAIMEVHDQHHRFRSSQQIAALRPELQKLLDEALRLVA